jgi:hypothetical protein
MKARAALLTVAWLLVSAAADAAAFERTEERQPCAERNPLRNPYFGDIHVHTTLSYDAWGQGTRNTPRDAYRFAKGEAIGIQPYAADGKPLRTVQLRRPLDFAVVTDHAELLGENHICRTPDVPGYNSLICIISRRWPLLGYSLVNSQILDISNPARYAFCGPGGKDCIEAAAVPWGEIQAAAEESYDRTGACRFTSFVGFEWSGAPESSMIHRNIVFRNAVVPRLPISYIEDQTPERLWTRLRQECLDLDNGCDVIAIPHNSNLSNGLLFRVETSDGKPFTREYAEKRSELEVLVEVTQHKGDSECRATGATADELCAFETLPFAKMRESATPWSQTPPPPLSYVREALAAGLVQETKIGANPFKLGLIGSTDTHLGTPGLADEDRFYGHAAGLASSRLGIPSMPDDVIFNPGGLAVVWAEENSRDALFDAMRRRETYGTTGPRMLVRFFGGWDYPADLCESKEFVARGYAGGVPMGSDLPPAPSGASRAPAFAVWALRDPGARDYPATMLQRIQIIKLWVEDGQPRERVYEVAGDPNNGAAVDPATCTRTATGFDTLCGVWRDPEFNAKQHALYYARVVENPSCRWNAYICNRDKVDCAGDIPEGMESCCDPAVPKTIQERAWTSPIWYQGLGG